MCEPARGGGSHYKIAHPQIAEKLTIPSKRPIKPVYIRELVAFVDKVRTWLVMSIDATAYPLIVEPLSEEDGGGFIARAPDLPGCMSDGETPEEAVVNLRDAIAAWIEAAQDLGHAIPAPRVLS